MGLQVSHSLENFLPKRRVKLSLSFVSESILSLFFLLLWLAPTVRWRVDLGSFSIALMEPVTLLVIGVLVLNKLSPGNRPKLYVNSFLAVLILFFMWILVSRPWDQNWSHGLSDVRDWGIPILTIVVLLSFVKHGWRKWLLLMIPIALLQSGIGIYQHITNGFRPFASLQSIYKLDFLAGSVPSFSVGLFEHPNSLAVFLIVAIIVSLGWLIEQNGIKRKLFPAAVILFLSIILYWTYAKAEILVLALMLFLFLAIPYIRSSRIFIALSLAILMTVLVVGWLAINRWPVEFQSIWWRIGLWKSVFQVISTHPSILLWGNGDIAFAATAIWPQPHNLVFDTLLNYGLVGVFLLLILFILIIRYGTLSYKKGDLKRNPVLRAVWISLIGFFVIGVVESSLLSIDTRMIFLLLVACFIGLRRDLTTELQPGSLVQSVSND
jgi:hypothetical protein